VASVVVDASVVVGRSAVISVVVDVPVVGAWVVEQGTASEVVGATVVDCSEVVGATVVDGPVGNVDVVGPVGNVDVVGPVGNVDVVGPVGNVDVVGATVVDCSEVVGAAVVVPLH